MCKKLTTNLKRRGKETQVNSNQKQSLHSGPFFSFSFFVRKEKNYQKAKDS